MAEPEGTTRRATAAERLAARALGIEEPEVIEVDDTSTAVKHLARSGRAAGRPVKPKGISTADWYASRALQSDGPGAA